MGDHGSVVFLAVGDVGPAREHPGEIYELARPILQKADIVFGQLEKNLSERGTVTDLLPYSLARTSPSVAGMLSDVGFDVMSFASNHTLDYGKDALLDTLDNLKKSNIEVIGAGRNIGEARRPAIFERNGTRVGILGYCSVGQKGWEAKPDKPGLAPVRVDTTYQHVDWQPGTPLKIITKANSADLAAMVEDIKRLRPLVDVLIVSQHWGIHQITAMLAVYQYEVGHAAIDAGADLVIGHHAHVLKGIEVYKGKVIFFDLCNFGFDQPLSHALAGPSIKFFEFPIDPEYLTYPFHTDAKKTIMARISIVDKKIERVAFLPLWVNKTGQPEPLKRSDPRSNQWMEYMEWLCGSQHLDTKFSREGDEVVVLT
jgi:hypothetical protein